MLRGIFLIIGASVLPVSLNAQPAGWNYAKPYVVTNSASALTLNYQLKMTINTQALVTAGQMQASGNDIRFGKNCSGSVLYNYWIESGMNTTATIIWVKIDSLPSLASKTMFMFYGNATAPAVSSIPLVFNGPHSASDSVASGGPGGLANSQRGFHFIPLEDLLVTSFGKREPTGSLRYVTLFDVSTQAVIVQRQISGPAAQYSYQPLTNAIWITQGIHYVIVLYSGASDGYYFGISNQSGQHVQYVETLYCNGCTQNTFPNIPLPGYHYGYADLLYWTKTTITPAPLVTEGTMAPLSLATSADVSICAGDSTQLTGVSSGGTGEYTFSWTPSVSLSAATNDTTFAFPVMNTTYTLTVADSLGCIATDNVTVTVNTLPSVTFNFPF
ncbi:MAG TPA: DUF2341 domain-containing protein, partial [Bacteroidia bacterium]|nr:DUF2341 domain-containing protein [Bacteroidia bacterium]